MIGTARRGRAPGLGSSICVVVAAVAACAGCVTGRPAASLGEDLRDIRAQIDQVRGRQAEVRRGLDALTMGPQCGSAEFARSSDPEALYREGYARHHSDDDAGAERCFALYLSLRPDSPHSDQALYWLGEAQWAQGNRAGAAEDWREIVRRYPDGEAAPQARRRLGMDAPAPSPP